MSTIPVRYQYYFQIPKIWTDTGTGVGSGTGSGNGTTFQITTNKDLVQLCESVATVLNTYGLSSPFDHILVTYSKKIVKKTQIIAIFIKNVFTFVARMRLQPGCGNCPFREV